MSLYLTCQEVAALPPKLSGYNFIHHSDDNIVHHSHDRFTAVQAIRFQLRAERIGVLWTLVRNDVTIPAALEADLRLVLKELVVLSLHRFFEPVDPVLREEHTPRIAAIIWRAAFGNEQNSIQAMIELFLWPRKVLLRAAAELLVKSVGHLREVGLPNNQCCYDFKEVGDILTFMSKNSRSPVHQTE